MSVHNKTLDNLVEQLKNLPGIGTRSAERIAYYILNAGKDEAMKLAMAIRDVKKDMKKCSVCFMLADTDPCEICQNQNRDCSQICVVEKTMDIYSIEKTSEFKGHYHVLGGLINPIENIGPDDLTFTALFERVRKYKVKELILALSPTLEGDATSIYISANVSDKNIIITRLARGLPAGGSLEYASKTMLVDALKGRTVFTKG